MKKAFTIVAFALALVGAASAQTPNNMHCSKPEDGTTVCVFDDGTVNETSLKSDGTYSSDWFTEAQWRHIQDGLREAKDLAPIVATAKLCKKGDLSKEFCDAFGSKNNLLPKYWECLLWDGTDTSYITCRQYKHVAAPVATVPVVKLNETDPLHDEAPPLPKYTGPPPTKDACKTAHGKWQNGSCQIKEAK